MARKVISFLIFVTLSVLNLLTYSNFVVIVLSCFLLSLLFYAFSIWIHRVHLTALGAAAMAFRYLHIIHGWSTFPVVIISVIVGILMILLISS